MRIDEVVSEAGLKAVVAPRAFSRGRMYLDEGEVRGLVVDPYMAKATVGDGPGETARIALDGRELRTACTCPSARPCAHVVAVALAMLAREPRASREAPAAPAPSGFASRAALEAWAAERRVTHALRWPAGILIDRLAVAPGWLFSGGVTIGDAAVETVVREAPMVAMARAEVTRAARAMLEEEAVAVVDGAAEEAVLLATVPAPAYATAWQRVMALRAAVRAVVPPRGSAALPGARLAFEPRDGGLLRWSDRSSVVEVRWRGDTASGTCACQALPGAAGELDDDEDGDELAVIAPAPALPRCRHVLAALDAMLRALIDGGAVAKMLVATIEREPWRLVLDQLEHLDQPRPHARPGEIWWRLRERHGFVAVVPTIRKPKGHGLTRGSETSPYTLRMGDYDVAPIDLAVGGILEGYPSGGAQQVRAALEKLVGHPRVVADDRDQTPIVVRRAPLAFELVASGDDLRLVATVAGRPLSPMLRRELERTGGAPIDLRPLDGECVLVDVDRRAASLLAALMRHGDRFPPAAHAALLDQLAAAGDRLSVAVPTTLLGTAWPAAPTVVLRVALDPHSGLALTVCIRPAAEAPLVTPGEGRDVLPVVRDGQRGHVQRGLADEVVRAQHAVAMLPVVATPDDTGPPWRYRVSDLDQALSLALALDELPPGVTAEWIAARPSVRRGATAAALRIHVDDKHDWFDVRGAIEVDDAEVDLAGLLEAARAQRRFVQLGPDRWLELADALRAQLARLEAHRTRVRGQVVSTVAVVPALLALADAGATVDGSATWRTLIERARTAERATPSVPSDLQATLRDYQREGYVWMCRLAAWGAGGVLADDMGLGKTVQTIALLCARAELGPALVIAPTSVAGNWMAELARFAPQLRARLLAERDARAEVIDGAGVGDVVVVSYALLVRERERLAARRFATVVFDEAQAIKNASTKRAQAARALDAEFRIALTGTPMENQVGELWSIFAAVFPPLFGPWEQFRRTYAVPIERDQSELAKAQLAQALRPFVLRRRKDEVARELPARTEVALMIPLSEDEAALYEQVRLAAVAKLQRALPELDANEQRIQILAELTRLRLAACHPRLHDPRSAVASSKLARLIELLDELRAQGHRALVFSQFVGHLALVREVLDAAGITYQYLDGATPAAARGERVAAFQGGAGDVFLISIKAGGTGLNLTAADYVIHLDPWWNPAVEDQASDRAHRIGQTRPVTIYRLVAADTIEARILTLHAAKRDLAAAVLDGTDGALRATSAELLALLGNEPRR